LVERVPCGGRTPRFFAFDPTGKWLLCSNHGSDTAVVFRVDETTGKLAQTGQPVSVSVSLLRTIFGRALTMDFD
jgi:6-phosphogluconolactonase